MKKRKITKAMIHIVAEYSHTPFEYLYVAYKYGIMNERRFFEMWNNALYYKGITKRRVNRFGKKNTQKLKDMGLLIKESV